MMKRQYITKKERLEKINQELEKFKEIDKIELERERRIKKEVKN